MNINVISEQETMREKCNKHDDKSKCPFKEKHDLLLKEATEIINEGLVLGDINGLVLIVENQNKSNKSKEELINGIN